MKKKNMHFLCNNRVKKWRWIIFWVWKKKGNNKSHRLTRAISVKQGCEPWGDVDDNEGRLERRRGERERSRPIGRIRLGARNSGRGRWPNLPVSQPAFQSSGLVYERGSVWLHQLHRPSSRHVFSCWFFYIYFPN